MLQLTTTDFIKKFGSWMRPQNPERIQLGKGCIFFEGENGQWLCHELPWGKKSNKLTFRDVDGKIHELPQVFYYIGEDEKKTASSVAVNELKKATARMSDEEESEEGVWHKSAYLGNLCNPSGKYRAAVLSPYDKDEYAEGVSDQVWWEVMEAAALEVGCFLSTGEGDPTDLFLRKRLYDGIGEPLHSLLHKVGPVRLEALGSGLGDNIDVDIDVVEILEAITEMA